MSLLVNKKLRELKISQILYRILKTSLTFFKIIRSLQEISKDLLKGNWSKVFGQMKKWFLRKKARIKYEISLGLKKLTGSSNRAGISVADDNNMGS